MSDYYVIEQYEGEHRTIDAYEDVESIIATLPDDDPAEIADAAKSASESPGETFDFPLPDATIEYRRVEPLERVMMRTDELESNEIMQQVIVTILDREEEDVIDVDRIVRFLEDEGADDLYMNFIAPAIDRCEQAIRGEGA